MNSISPQQEEQIKEFIDQRRMIDAIKLYREATGVGLKEAKDAVTEMWHGKSVQSPPIDPDLQGDALLEEQIKRLLAKRQKIQAVKLYRETYNCGLKEAKDAVDAIEIGMRTGNYSNMQSTPAIRDDPFAEDSQRNRRFLAILIAVVLLVIGGVAFFLLAGNGF